MKQTASPVDFSQTNFEAKCPGVQIVDEVGSEFTEKCGTTVANEVQLEAKSSSSLEQAMATNAGIDDVLAVAGMDENTEFNTVETENGSVLYATSVDDYGATNAVILYQDPEDPDGTFNVAHMTSNDFESYNTWIMGQDGSPAGIKAYGLPFEERHLPQEVSQFNNLQELGQQALGHAMNDGNADFSNIPQPDNMPEPTSNMPDGQSQFDQAADLVNQGDFQVKGLPGPGE